MFLYCVISCLWSKRGHLNTTTTRFTPNGLKSIWSSEFQVLDVNLILKNCPGIVWRVFLNTITVSTRGGSQKRKSTNDGKHGHGQEKMKPSTLCGGKKCRRRHVRGISPQIICIICSCHFVSWLFIDFVFENPIMFDVFSMGVRPRINTVQNVENWIPSELEPGCTL